MQFAAHTNTHDDGNARVRMLEDVGDGWETFGDRDEGHSGFAIVGNADELKVVERPREEVDEWRDDDDQQRSSQT